MTTTVDFKTKADEIIKNLIKTKKIFTAYHVTIVLRNLKYQLKHHDIRSLMNQFDFASEGYTKTLSTTNVFQIAANIYHPIGATQQELLDFEKSIEDRLNNGGENKPLPSSLTQIKTPAPSVPQPALVSPSTGPKPISSLRLKSDTVKVNSDARGRICIPAKVVRKYFKAGDKVGITATPVNLSIAPYDVNGKYSATLTVDSYDNIRINSAQMHTKGGDVTVNFDDRNKTIVLV